MPSKKCGYQSNFKHKVLMKKKSFYVLILRVGMHEKVWLQCGYHCFLLLFKCGYESNFKHKFLIKYQSFYLLILRVGMHEEVWLPLFFAFV